LIIEPLLQSSSEYLQEFHGSLTTSIFQTWHGKFLQLHLEAKQENTFSLFKSGVHFQMRIVEEIQRREKDQRIAQI